jgi:spermidine synthase
MVQWFKETLYDDFAAMYRIGTVVYEEKSEHQDLIVFDHDRFGRILALDNIVQVTSSDEFIYHEMMAHLPILAHGGAKRVLIIGGGDGGVLRHCLMHPTIEHVTQVEIDQSVIDLCVKYMPMISAGAYDDPRAHVVIADGAKFVAETDQKFDVVVVDSTDPIGPGRVLFEPEFYAAAVGCLTEQGVIVTQSGVPLWEPISSQLTHVGLKPLVADFGFTRAPVPTYVGGDMLLGWGCKSPSVRQTSLLELRKRYADSGIVTKFYTPEVHVGAFAIPPAYLAHLT